LVQRRHLLPFWTVISSKLVFYRRNASVSRQRSLQKYVESEGKMPIGFDEIQVEKAPAGTIITLKFREKLDKGDYDEFVPMIESQIEHGSPIRMVVELHDFQGWTAGALWEDTKFAARHFNDIERLAVVGEARWETGVTVFVKPFTSADVRYFMVDAREKAREWVRGA
jgi:hypothetical protein